MPKFNADQMHKMSQERICDSIARVQKTTAKYGEANVNYGNFYAVADSDSSLSFYDKGVVAGLLDNFHKVMDSDEGRIVSQNYGPYVPEILPLITAWYPEFPLKDLISVQTMDQALGYIFRSDLLVGNGKGNQAFGDKVETSLGVRNLKGQYPTGEVFGETIPASQFSGTTSILAYSPLKTSSNQVDFSRKFKVVLKGATAADDVVLRVNGPVGGDVITLTTEDGTSGVATLDRATGAIDITTGDISNGVVVNYVWDIDTAETYNLPKIKENITKTPIEAIARAITMEWSIFSEYLKKSQFGKDIREDNTKRILALLYQYQVRYILDDMYENRDAANDADINVPGASTVTLDVKVNTVLENLNVVSNKIELTSGRMMGNRLVVGSAFKSFLEALPNTWYTPAKNANGYGFSSPRELGEFGPYKVYYDPTLENGAGWMTYRGSEWYDAAYILGEYMPVVPTDAIALGVTIRESFCSMEAYYYDKPNCVIGLDFHGIGI